MKKNLSALMLFSLLALGQPGLAQAWRQYSDSALYYKQINNISKAIEFYGHAKEELSKDSSATGSYANICDSLGAVLYLTGKYPDAEKVFLEARELREKLFGKQTEGYAASTQNLGRAIFQTGDYEQAANLFLESKQLWALVKGKESAQYAASCNRVGIVFGNLAKYADAETNYLEAKRIWQKLYGKESTDYFGVCNNLLILYIEMQQYDKAESVGIEAKEVQEKLVGKENRAYATVCTHLGNAYASLGEYQKAESLYIEAMQIRERIFGKDHPEYANSCFFLGSMYKSSGQYEKAENLLIESRDIQAKVGGRQTVPYSASVSELGRLYAQLGQFKKAEPLLIESKQILEGLEGKESPDYGMECNNLATLYKNLMEFEKSEALYQEAMEVAAKVLGRESESYAIYSFGLANLYELMDQYEKAEPLAIAAKQILVSKFGKQFPDYITACNDLGVIYQDLGKYPEAEAEFVEARRVQMELFGKQHPDYGLYTKNLAYIYWLLGKPLLADKEFKEYSSSNVRNLSSAFAFMNETEKNAYIKNINGTEAMVFSFYVAEKFPSAQPYDLSLFYRNLVLSSSENLQKQLFYANDTSISKKFNEWRGIKENLSVLYTKPIGERQQDVQTLEDKAGLLEKELTKSSSGFRKQDQQVSWKNIQSKLLVGEAAIEFASFPFYNGREYSDSVFYVASILTRNSTLPSTVFLCTEQQLASVLSSGSGISQNEIDQTYLDGNGSLYKLIWVPLEKELQNIKTIYFAPTGLLHRVSFAAIPLNGKTLLSDRFKLVQLTSTATIAEQNPAYIVASDNLQLFGGIQYDVDSALLKEKVKSNSMQAQTETTRSIPDDIVKSGSFTYLPGTETEIKLIEGEATSLHHISVKSGVDASEESFKALNGKASPSVIHIATHGFFFPDPSADAKDKVQRSFETNGRVFKQSEDPLFRSGLLFAGANLAWQGKPVEGIEDGILTAYEVSNMYLPNTKLVVLSACETALGDIHGSEGVYGLERAFKIAGVQNLVMSLWKVPDAETSEFMQLFYKNLFSGLSISDGFYKAQAIMKNKYRDQPFKWAAWILVR